MPQKPKYSLNDLEGLSGSIGPNIAKIRKAKGITQSELGRKIGISQRLISHYEKQRLQIAANMLTRFALALNVPADEILGITKSRRTESTQDLTTNKRIRELELLPPTDQKKVTTYIQDLIKKNKTPD